MPIVLEGQMIPVTRVSTGLHLLDRAMADGENIGMPLRSIYEVYGKWACGKSSLSYYLASCIRPTGIIALADLEMNMNPEFVIKNMESAGFEGTFRSIDLAVKEGKKLVPRDHELVLQECYRSLSLPDVNAVILDSVGGYLPKALMDDEIETPIDDETGERIGAGQLGLRAKAFADFMRRSSGKLRLASDAKAAFLVNHQLSDFGSRGHTTPGGDTVKYLCNMRLQMWRFETLDNGCFISQIKPEKVKYGGTAKEKVAYVFIIPGFGVSPLMTAVFSCFKLKLAERGSYVKIGGKSFGRLNDLIDKAQKPKEFGREFKPFYDKLDEYFSSEIEEVLEGEGDE